MIRIDEIYQNVFLPRVTKLPGIGLHWFDPFGSTDIKDLVNLPAIPWGNAQHRILFWDQEPLRLDKINNSLLEFKSIYDGPVTMIVSEKNNREFESLCSKFDIDYQYYFFHGWAALDWYRGYNRSFLMIPFSQRNIDHTFLCMNNIIGGERRHRLTLLSELSNRNLIKNNLISFPAVCPHENVSAVELCRQYGVILKNVELPLILDRSGNNHNQSCHITSWDFSNQSLLQVVTETLYYGDRQHLTEKTFKPIVMQQPFILVSCRGSLEYLRSYGFQTFGEFWDESYDDLDDMSRIKAIGNLLSDIDAMSIREKSQLQKHLCPVVKYNFQWFYSQDFEQLLWDELTAMIDTF